MTSVPLGVIAIITALVAASWAALLALAEESPKVTRALADTATEREEPTTRYRIIHLSRLALLCIAGVSGAYAVEWWQMTPLPGLGVIIVSVVEGNDVQARRHDVPDRSLTQGEHSHHEISLR